MTWYLRDRLPYRLNSAGIARGAELALARRDSTQVGPQPRAMPGAPSAVPQVTPPQGGGPR